MKRYIKILAVCMLCLSISVAPVRQTQAAPPLAILEIIKAGVKKVIKAIDLKIQRKQNKVIWLQNAQKVLENAMSKLKLDEISEWTEKHREQYRKYFDGLRQVKTYISYYRRVRDIMAKQVRIVEEYQRAWSLIRRDNHFTSDELRYMEKVYTGILGESLKNLDQLSLAVNAFKTQMGDAQRLGIINKVGDRVDGNLSDLRAFNTQNAVLSLQRTRSEAETELVKKLYGLD